jgi:hypothetical protein
MRSGFDSLEQIIISKFLSAIVVVLVSWLFFGAVNNIL